MVRVLPTARLGLRAGDVIPSVLDDVDWEAGELKARGKSNKVIAYELQVTESTVKAHVSAILRKLQVTSRTQAVLNASKLLVRSRAIEC